MKFSKTLNISKNKKKTKKKGRKGNACGYQFSCKYSGLLDFEISFWFKFYDGLSSETLNTCITLNCHQVFFFGLEMV